MSNLKFDPSIRTRSRLHPEGQGRRVAGRCHPGRLRLHDPHRCRTQLHRLEGQRSAGAALDTRLGRRFDRDLHVEGRGGPSRDWLKFVASRRAANKIKQWYTRERREDAIEEGREDLIQALRREGLACRILKEPVFAEVIEAMNYVDEGALYAAIGEGHVTSHHGGRTPRSRVAWRGRAAGRGRDKSTSLNRHPSHWRPSSPTQAAGVHVEGLDDIMIRLSDAAPRFLPMRSSGSSPVARACRCTAATA